MGARRKYWDALIAFIQDHYSPAQEFRFMYGKDYGWAFRFQRKGKALASLYPTRGGFTIHVILSEAGVETVRQVALGAHLPKAIEAAFPYPEGRWLFVPVETDADLQDVYQLIRLRAEEKRLNTSR